MRTFYNYILFDPRNNEPFYVGKGSGNRYNDHFAQTMRCSKNNKKLENKIKKIHQETGLKPMILIINKTTDEQLSFMAEKELILKYRMDGYDLCNLTDGGEGFSGRTHTTKSKIKMSVKLTGKKHTDEAKRKIGEASIGNKYNIGRKASEETKKKMSDVKKGKKHSEETKKKMSENNGMKGKKISSEQKTIISNRQKGNKNFLGKKHSDITKQKISNTKTGKKHSEETKQKMSEARKLYLRKITEKKI